MYYVEEYMSCTCRPTYRTQTMEGEESRLEQAEIVTRSVVQVHF